MKDETTTKMVALAKEYGLPITMADAAALEKYTDEIMRRTAAVETKYEPNVCYAYGTDGAGKKTWQMITGNGDNPSQIISSALELVRAIKRGIDIPPGVLFKHLVGREPSYPMAEPMLPLEWRKTLDRAKALLTVLSTSGMISRNDDSTLTPNAMACIDLVCDIGAILATKSPKEIDTPEAVKL